MIHGRLVTLTLGALAILGIFATGCGNSSAGEGGDAGASAGGSRGSDATIPGAGGVEAKSVAPACGEEPYPVNSSACPARGLACVPKSGFACCRCDLGHGCAGEFAWACDGTNIPTCPATPPLSGAPCPAEGVSCTYCSQPAVSVTCKQGKWKNVLDELYCSP